MYLHCIAIFSCPNPPFEAKNRKKAQDTPEIIKCLLKGERDI